MSMMIRSKQRGTKGGRKNTHEGEKPQANQGKRKRSKGHFKTKLGKNESSSLPVASDSWDEGGAPQNIFCIGPRNRKGQIYVEEIYTLDYHYCIPPPPFKMRGTCSSTEAALVSVGVNSHVGVLKILNLHRWISKGR